MKLKNMYEMQPEDYDSSVFSMPSGNRNNSSIPIQRVVEKLEDYMSRRDYDSARRHLLYWKEEAKQMGDLRGLLSVCNELIGHYRKVNMQEEAFALSQEALELLESLDLTSALTAGTTYINIATAQSSFGEYTKALDLFEKARAVYESHPDTSPRLLGGLYNNMGIALTAAGRYEPALELFQKALFQMDQVPAGALEQAVTLLNMADLIAARDGMEAGEKEIYSLLDRAYDFLVLPEIPRDGYYAFVCEKCAPSFEYYGYFAAAQELRDCASQIYQMAQDSRRSIK